MTCPFNSHELGLTEDNEPLSILGYSDRLSVIPGESLNFYVTTNEPEFDATIVELIGSMTDPDSGTIPTRDIDAACGGRYQGSRQATDLGSFAVLPLSTPFSLGSDFTVTIRFSSTTPRHDHDQTIWEITDTGGERCRLVISPLGQLSVKVGAESLLDLPSEIVDSEWYRVTVVRSRETLRIRLERTSGWAHGDKVVYDHGTSSDPLGRAAGPVETEAFVTLAGSVVEHAMARPRANEHFNGKLEAPALIASALDLGLVHGLEDSALSALDYVVGSWDFASDFSSRSVVDRAGLCPIGTLMQGPLRAVTGHNWSGRKSHFLECPEQYAAIHFHEDDLEDCDWAVSVEWDVPRGTSSGIYALRVESSTTAAVDYIPFVVRPTSVSSARALLLLPTYTYLAYANDRLFEDAFQADYMEHEVRIAPQDEFISSHPEVGKSAYDVHSDGSGVAHTSWRRPILNMRPHYRSWLTGHTRHLGADLMLLEWLRWADVEFDIVTDGDLDDVGASILDGYRVVLTGSHPEYWTRSMMEALESYFGEGGRLMYLGGNGFYWVTSSFSDRPMLEIRRGNNGTRCWDSPPGETPHSASGEPGGLWRYNGYSPHRMVGVGMAAQGWGAASAYRRLPDSFDERVRFIFEGISDDDVIGERGHVLGGAAGDEVDRFAPELGSPVHALRLATAPDLDNTYQLTQEELLMTLPGQGGDECDRVRSDLTYLETAAGGAVFSVGSICWTGSLTWNGCDNNVSRVTYNVLKRFTAPDPL